LVRRARREYDKALKIPAELQAEFTRTTARAEQTWIKARAASDFSIFQPALERIFDLARQRAEHWGYDEHLYDALLDQFEPGMKTSEVRAIFDPLRAQLVPIVDAIRGQSVDAAVLAQDFPFEGQIAFSKRIAEQFGFDFTRGRHDTTTHPFCTMFSRDDVRLTTRHAPDDLASTLFGMLHEAGHALYNQGIAPQHDDNILGYGASLGVHESQSRLWENVVGRSRAFWSYFYPQLQSMFPGYFDGVSQDTFYRAINKAEPSFIRVRADEITYPLHIMLRFDLELAVFDGEVAVRDLPDAWNAKMEDYLGIIPPNDSQGVLQDIHWAGGTMGYFPTYALGNLLSVQLYDLAVEAHPNIPEDIARGEFGDLLGWMRKHIHSQGRKYLPGELVQRVTGVGFQTEPYLDYIRDKYSDIYDI
ncbi:MAG: carboxypeptidase M32, partial [Anaerolineales bacterium]